MAPIIQKLTLPKFDWFGFLFKKGQILKEYLSDSENHWFIVEEQIQDEPTSKLTSLTEEEAKYTLNANETVIKIDKKPFCVNLSFENLTLCDNNTLSLNITIRVNISDPQRFYRRYIAQFNNEPTLEANNLHTLWEAPFRNVLQVEAHKYNLDNWKVGLTETAIKKAFEQYYFAPMAIDYIDGTNLELVESVEGYSPSEKQRLQEELARRQKELEEEERLRITAQNKAEHEAKLEAMREQVRLAELEIKNKEQERLNQEAEYQRRIEEEERKAKLDHQRKLDEERIAMAHSNKWPALSVKEKTIAIDFSILMKNQAEICGVEMKNTAISASSLFYQGVLGEWNTLRQGESLDFSLVSSKSGVVTILNLGTSGKMTILVPNSLTGSDTIFVSAEQGVRYRFPESFMPDLDAGSFVENSTSGLEGVYVIVTEEPLFNMEETGDLTVLPCLSYDKVQETIDKLKDLDPQSWGAGCLEFEVVR